MPAGRDSLRIVVSGLIAQHPSLGGMTWHYLQYLAGLARLGHDVFYFEDSGEVPYTLDGGATGHDWVAPDCSENVRYLSEVLARYGLEDRWAYRYPPDARWFGLPDDRREAVLRTADLLLNVSGTLERPDAYRCIPRLAYLDTDPVVTQTKYATGQPGFPARVDVHDVHFSFGERFTEVVPVTGHRWLPTRQPIVLSDWEPAAPDGDAFTTVMSWTSYAPLHYAGRVFGQKDVEFQRFIELPERVAPVRMEVALARTEHRNWQSRLEELPASVRRRMAGSERWTPQELLARTGWHVVDANERCGDLDRYRHYIRSSRGEWGVAKNAYVQGRPGWFSERSACYLASGRPVVVQDTGFGEVLPVGEGLLAFETLEQAAEALREVDRDHRRHARAARAVAEACFDSDKVLPALLDRALAGGPPGAQERPGTAPGTPSRPT